MLDRAVRPLPTKVEDIDRDWINAALRVTHPGVTVRKMHMVDFMRSTCTKIRLRLEMDEAGRRAGIPETVILKGGFEPHSRTLAHMHAMEVRGYRDIFSKVELPTPRCYFADYDAERLQGIVIMEDLVARGVTFCNALRPQRFEEVARRLMTLAKFHAETWESAQFAPGGTWADMTSGYDTWVTLLAQFTPQRWQEFAASPRGAAASVRFHDRAVMTQAFANVVKLAHSRPQCLCHGDTHLGNLYVDPDGSPGFFDGAPNPSPGVGEFAYHVGGALDTADRRRWEGPLLQLYLSELARFGAKAPTFDSAWNDYRAYLIKGYIVFLLNESFFQPEAVNTAYTARYSAAMVDHNSLDLVSRLV
jgi:Ecdysteroid kinase-like family